MFEKKWPSVIIPNISVANHVVTVSSTLGLHPKQKISIGPDELEVKRILSLTTLQVGPVGPISKIANPIHLNGETLTAIEQERNAIDANAGIRASYAEEPTVAIRTTLVDYFGRNYATTEIDGKPALKVDASLVSDLVPGVDFDAIYPTYTSLTDTWQYYKGAAVVRTIVITYTAPDKKTIAPMPGGVRYV